MTVQSIGFKFFAKIIKEVVSFVVQVVLILTLQATLLNYEAPHISGSLLDHFYINRQTLQKISIEAIQTVSVYFSDHQAVKFKLRLL